MMPYFLFSEHATVANRPGEKLPGSVEYATVLLYYRARATFPLNREDGCDKLFGGGVEATDHNPRAAAIRELREELPQYDNLQRPGFAIAQGPEITIHCPETEWSDPQSIHFYWGEIGRAPEIKTALPVYALFQAFEFAANTEIAEAMQSILITHIPDEIQCKTIGAYPLTTVTYEHLPLAHISTTMEFA